MTELRVRIDAERRTLPEALDAMDRACDGKINAWRLWRRRQAEPTADWVALLLQRALNRSVELPVLNHLAHEAADAVPRNDPHGRALLVDVLLRAAWPTRAIARGPHDDLLCSLHRALDADGGVPLAEEHGPRWMTWAWNKATRARLKNAGVDVNARDLSGDNLGHRLAKAWADDPPGPVAGPHRVDRVAPWERHLLAWVQEGGRLDARQAEGWTVAQAICRHVDPEWLWADQTPDVWSWRGTDPEGASAFHRWVDGALLLACNRPLRATLIKNGAERQTLDRWLSEPGAAARPDARGHTPFSRLLETLRVADDDDHPPVVSFVAVKRALEALVFPLTPWQQAGVRMHDLRVADESAFDFLQRIWRDRTADFAAAKAWDAQQRLQADVPAKLETRKKARF